ncbi:MAG: HEAT repeat domain-containing protein, partial [Terriglobia bacterium]
APASVPSLRFRWDRAAAEEAVLCQAPAPDPEKQGLLRDLYHRWGFYDTRRRRLQGGTRWQQARSALVLAQLGFKEALPAIIPLLESRSADVRLAAINALGTFAEPNTAEALLLRLSHGDGREARAILMALLRCVAGTPGRMTSHLQHESKLVRIAAAATLAELARPAQTDALLEAVDDPEPEVRSRVARALGRTGDRRALIGLQRLAVDPVWFVRLQAHAVLRRFGSAGTMESLGLGLEDSDGRVQAKAAVSLYYRLGDAAGLLRRLRSQGASPEAVGGLVDEMARHGTTWRAISSVCSPLGVEREPSQALLAELLRAGYFAATFDALESHANLDVRDELLRLVEQHAGPAAAVHVLGLLASSTVEDATRQRAAGLLARWEAKA